MAKPTVIEVSKPGRDGYGTALDWSILRADVDAVAASVDEAATAAVNASPTIADHETRLSIVEGGDVSLPAISGLFFHLDAQTIVADDKARIASWVDEVTGTVTATQDTAGQRPRYDVTGINGRPALLFDSVRNDTLTASGLTPGAHQATVFIVATKQAHADTNHYLFGTSGSPKNLFQANDGRVGLQSVALFTTDALDAVPQIVTGVFNDASSSLRIDGVATDGDAGIATTLPTVFSVGHRVSGAAAQGFTGYIGEVLYWNRALTAAECARVERYLAARWGITTTPQTTWYVDSVYGNDANTGRSATTPILTMARAFAGIKAAKVDDATIAIRAPERTPLRVLDGLTLNMGGTIRLVSATPGQKWHLYGSQRITAGWTSMGGGVYSRALSIGTDVAPVALATTLLDDEGQQTRIVTRNTATPATPAAGEYGYSGGTYYLHLPGNANPNAHTIEIATAYSLFNISAGTAVDGKDAALMGAQGNIVTPNGDGASAPGFVSFTDSDAWFAAGSGWATSGDHVGMRLTRCRGWYCANDGFSHHGSAGNIAIMELVACEGMYNGDEGVSPHDDTRLILRGGAFHHNGHGGLTSVGNAETQLVGTEFYANRTKDSTLTGWDSGGVAILEQSSLISVDLYSHDHPGPGVEIDTAGGATWIDNGGTRSGTANGNGAEDAV